jgi:hypothetical protein
MPEELEIPEQLVRYIAARDRERDERVNRALDALTARERVLVREAAVMGYVQGWRTTGRASTEGEGFPKDMEIVRLVIDACRAFSDLYPNLATLGETSGEPSRES